MTTTISNNSCYTGLTCHVQGFWQGTHATVNLQWLSALSGLPRVNELLPSIRQKAPATELLNSSAVDVVC